MERKLFVQTYRNWKESAEVNNGDKTEEIYCIFFFLQIYVRLLGIW